MTDARAGGRRAKVVAAALTALTLAAFGGSAAAQERAEVRTWAVIVANNSSIDPGAAPLRYADDDGARYAELFEAMGAEVTLLTRLDADSRLLFEAWAERARLPTRENVLGAFARVRRAIDEAEQGGAGTQLYVVFTGHGAVDEQGMGYLSLHDGKLTREELRGELIAPQPADHNQLIIDACNAWFMVQARGDDEARTGQTRDDELEAWLRGRDALAASPRVGVLLSTSGAAEVHEWSRFGAGVFSHQVRSGLLGAADIDGDARVTWIELETWLAAANARVTNPRARVAFYARPPAQDGSSLLFDLRELRGRTWVEFGPTAAGRWSIEDGRGVRWADLNVAGDAPIRVALLWEPTWRAPVYFVRTEDAELRVEADGAANGVWQVEPGALVARADAPRGSVEEAYRQQLFAAPWGQAFFEGYQAAARRVEDGGEGGLARATAGGEGWIDGFGLDAGYFGASPLFDLGGVQHNVELAAAAWLTPRVALRLVGEYGTSGHDGLSVGAAPFRLHRASIGVGALGEWPLVGALRLRLDGHAGHQWIIHQGEGAAFGDSVAVRAVAAAGVGWDVAPGLLLGLRLGGAADVVTLDGREDLSLTPLVGVVLELR